MSEYPSILLPETKNARPVSLATALLRERKVFYMDEVNAETANSLVQQLLYLESQDAEAPITLYINSPGGNIVDGMGIYDTMRRLSCPVHAVVVGMAASMGAVILSGCERGERRIYPHGEVLLHQPLGGAEGAATDIQISAKRILKLKEMILHLLADNCAQDYERVVEDCDRDHWLDAPAAKEYGIIDEVLE